MKTTIKKTIMILLSLLFICLVFIGYLFLGNNIGISKNDIISEVRKLEKITDDWTTCEEVVGTTAACISYPQDKSNHSYSIFVNKKGLSFGYFFRDGGRSYVVENSIGEYTITGYSDRTFISMNNQNVVRVDIDTENGIETRELKSGEPFVFILENNPGDVTFYDVDGNVVEYINQPL